jgi:O-antigen ligase
VNGGLLLLQESGIWNPFITPELIESIFGLGKRDVTIEAERYSTALLGNTNDAGGYLSLCAVAAGALIGMRRFQRSILLGFGFLSVSVILSRSLSAIAALTGGLLALAFLKSRRWVLTAVIALPLVVVGASTLSRALNNRLRQARAAVRAGNYDALLSNRLAPFISALNMARDHPWSGVGPGCFTYEYFPYRLRVEALKPSLIGSGEAGVMFGEVHNDYLQVLAESGIPGLAILVAALFALAKRSFQRARAGEKDRVESELVGRRLSLPLAITFSILAIGHFPLEVAAEAQLLTLLAGVSIAWTSHESS